MIYDSAGVVSTWVSPVCNVGSIIFAMTVIKLKYIKVTYTFGSGSVRIGC